MIYKCDVKGCENYPAHHVTVGNTKFAVCSDHNEAMFELGRKFDEEIINLGRKYFKLALNLKEEDHGI